MNHKQFILLMRMLSVIVKVIMMGTFNSMQNAREWEDHADGIVDEARNTEDDDV